MITITHERDDHFHVGVRHHGLVVDQPREDGGDDMGPTPTELFVASLAACAAFYARRFLARHHLPTEGLRVDCDYELSADRPARVAWVSMDVVLPRGFPSERREALMRVIDRCTVKNSLRLPPEITVELNEQPQVA